MAEEGEAAGGPTDCRGSCARGTRAAGFAGGPVKEPLQPAEPEEVFGICRAVESFPRPHSKRPATASPPAVNASGRRLSRRPPHPQDPPARDQWVSPIFPLFFLTGRFSRLARPEAVILTGHALTESAEVGNRPRRKRGQRSVGFADGLQIPWGRALRHRGRVGGGWNGYGSLLVPLQNGKSPSRIRASRRG